MWRNISKTKKVIYWANEDIDLPLQEDDVIQWWGDSETIDQIAGNIEMTQAAKMKSSSPTTISPIWTEDSEDAMPMTTLPIKIGERCTPSSPEYPT